MGKKYRIIFESDEYISDIMKKLDDLGIRIKSMEYDVEDETETQEEVIVETMNYYEYLDNLLEEVSFSLFAMDFDAYYEFLSEEEKKLLTNKFYEKNSLQPS